MRDKRLLSKQQAVLFLASLVMAISLVQVAYAGSYNVLSLGILDGDNASNAISITGSGKVLCGTSRDSSYGFAVWSSSTGLNRIWSSVSGLNEEPLPNNSVVLRGINSAGNAAGWYNEDTAIVMDSEGQIHDLASLTGPTGAWASAINDDGLVVGSSSYNAVLWQADGTPTALAGTLEAPAVAKAISDNGFVLYTQSTGLGSQKSYIWKPGGITQQLEQPSGTEGISNGGRAINNLGQVVGTLGGHAILWNPDGSIATDLGVGAAFDINNLGQIVGTLDGRVVVWDSNFNATDLPAPDGWSAVSAVSINDSGQIAGTIFDQATNTYSTAVLWQPVPEPSSLLALIGGLGYLGAFLKRRR